MTYKYGWIPDLPDVRDYKFTAPPTIELPPIVDNSGMHPIVYDQGKLGSCTANSSALAYDFARVKAGLAAILPSRLMVYYDERVIEGTVKYDSGAMNRDAIKTLADTGVCPEKYWPYTILKFAKRPTQTAYKQAAPHKISLYERINNLSLQDLKAAIVNNSGFIFGISVYSSFQNPDVAKTGIIPMPDTSNEKLLGGHSIFACGYNDNTQMIKGRNSWSDQWGDKGHFYIPYAYLTNQNMADDFWAIEAAT